NVWYGAPFFLIMYLAALKSVPEQLYEAAAIDGANWWQKIWYVTLPMMRNIISITVLFSLIVTFANFDIVRILTSGGPIDQSHFFLMLFVVFFLTPPIYMMITSLKSSAEIGAITNPWWVYDPTLENYWALLGSEQYLTFFKNSVIVSVVVVIITMLISIPAAF